MYLLQLIKLNRESAKHITASFTLYYTDVTHIMSIAYTSVYST